MENQFIENFKEAVETDTEITMDSKFRDLEEWDSLAGLSVIAMLDDEYDVVIEGEKFTEMHTLRDIYKHIQNEKAE